jgi:hypothetical protein
MERPIGYRPIGDFADLCGAVSKVEGITLPPGFSHTAVADVASPTALAFTPDGRLLIAVQAGRLWVYQNGVLSPTPALDLTGRICTSSERGLLGVAVCRTRSTCPRRQGVAHHLDR